MWRCGHNQDYYLDYCPLVSQGMKLSSEEFNAIFNFYDKVMMSQYRGMGPAGVWPLTCDSCFRIEMDTLMSMSWMLYWRIFLRKARRWVTEGRENEVTPGKLGVMVTYWHNNECDWMILKEGDRAGMWPGQELYKEMTEWWRMIEQE